MAAAASARVDCRGVDLDGDRVRWTLSGAGQLCAALARRRPVCLATGVALWCFAVRPRPWRAVAVVAAAPGAARATVGLPDRADRVLHAADQLAPARVLAASLRAAVEKPADD